MSFISELSKYTGYLGRGLEDLFTLGGAEIARKNTGGDFFNILDKGVGANFEAGATGGSAMLGAQGLGMVGGSAGGAAGGSGAGGMAAYTPTSAPNMGAAGSTLGPGGMFSPLNPMGAGGTGSAFASAGGAPSSLNTALKLMRMMPQGGQQQPPAAQSRQDQEMRMRLIYSMFPNLRPGASLHGGLGAQGGING